MQKTKDQVGNAVKAVDDFWRRFRAGGALGGRLADDKAPWWAKKANLDEQLATPLEKFKEQLEDLEDIFKHLGDDFDDTLGRALAKGVDDLERAAPPCSPGPGRRAS